MFTSTILTYATDRFSRESDTRIDRLLHTVCDSSPMSATVTEPDPRRTVLRVIVTTLVVLALTTAATVMVAYNKLDGGIDQGKDIEHRVKPVGGDALNILVMGSDERAGAGNDIGRRSDTTILVHISADRSEVYGVSLPRDALVTRPDCKDADGETVEGDDLQMFNSAFSVGGEVCTVAMVEELTGIYIDHYISLDFNGFKDMVDAVDGVTVCIPEAVDDPEHDIYFDAGTQVLRGQQALNYVRERSQLSANSDIGRMKRPTGSIASMINKVISANTLTKPYRVYNFIEAATTSITPDPELASLRQAGHPGPAVPQHEPRRHRVHHRAVHVLRARPQPAGLGTRGGRAVGADHRRQAARQKLSGQVVTASDPVGGSASPAGGASETPSDSRYAGWRRRRRRDRERPVHVVGAGMLSPGDADTRRLAPR